MDSSKKLDPGRPTMPPVYLDRLQRRFQEWNERRKARTMPQLDEAALLGQQADD